jgi:hypothetical protein
LELIHSDPSSSAGASTYTTTGNASTRQRNEMR